MWHQIVDYAIHIDLLELAGLVFGLLAVYFLIKQNILTWPAGIIYIFISFVIFWRIQLYGDFILHVFFLILNVYGWLYWKKGREKKELPVTNLTLKQNAILLGITTIGVVFFGYFLAHLPQLIDGLTPASVPYWDATTSILSVTAMWLTTQKKIENWYYWFAVDILACGIYMYKGIHFYSVLYGVYIVLAVWGYLAWRKDQLQSN